MRVAFLFRLDDRTSQFTKNARESRELAERAQTDHERALYEDMASHWEALAELWPRVGRFSRDCS